MAKTVIFDLGGVLVRLNWENVCAPLASLSDLDHSNVWKEVQNGPIVQSSMLGRLDPREFHIDLCAKLRIDVPFDQFIVLWNGLLSTNDELTPLVKGLSSDHRLILASNTDAIHFEYSRQHFDVLNEFDGYFLSYEMRLLKPDPAYFRHVLDGLQASASDCIFIDDRPENVQSAQEMGINGLVFESVDRLRADLETAL